MLGAATWILACAASSVEADPASAINVTPGQANMAGMHMKAASTAQVSRPFLVSNGKSYEQLMGEAMSIMEVDMAQAAMTGNPDHDFASMMIPHHQGAVDMAKVELLYGKDPVLRRLAQEIIVTQESEIQVMRMQTEKLRGTPSRPIHSHESGK